VKIPTAIQNTPKKISRGDILIYINRSYAYFFLYFAFNLQHDNSDFGFCFHGFRVKFFISAIVADQSIFFNWIFITSTASHLAGTANCEISWNFFNVASSTNFHKYYWIFFFKILSFFLFGFSAVSQKERLRRSKLRAPAGALRRPLKKIRRVKRRRLILEEKSWASQIGRRLNKVKEPSHDLPASRSETLLFCPGATRIRIEKKNTFSLPEQRIFYNIINCYYALFYNIIFHCKIKNVYLLEL